VSCFIHSGPPSGLVSTYLTNHIQEGDLLQIGVPCGDFVLNTNRSKPIVFISGGVGLTPVLSMFEALLSEGHSTLPIYYIDAVKNTDVEAMHTYFSNASSKHLNVNVKFIYDETPNEWFAKGPINIDHVKSAVPFTDAHFYLCGPKPFMRGLLKGLKESGVPANQIHYEFFGPHGDV
jgi:nitric oxide dioxygenase